MAKWVCDVCGYVYDPEVGDPDNGVAAGTAWDDVPEEWVCPLCGVGKDQSSEMSNCMGYNKNTLTGSCEGVFV